jgi:hypothetical protein
MLRRRKAVEPQDEFEQFRDDLRRQVLDPAAEHTLEETVRSFRFLDEQLGAACANLEANPDPSELEVALRNLARYARWLLLMFRHGLGSPIEFYGWASRGLFELYLLTLFVLLSEENVRLFLHAAMTDEIMMMEGIEQLEADITPDVRANLRAQIERLEAARGDRVSRLPDYASMATAVGARNEYDAFWKIYSKYVHPSSWVVNGQPAGVRNVAYQQMFRVQAQFNAHRIGRLAQNNARTAEG